MNSAFFRAAGLGLLLGLAACGDNVAIQSTLVDDALAGTDDSGVGDGLDDSGLGSDAGPGTDVGAWELPPLDVQGTDALIGPDADAIAPDAGSDAASDTTTDTGPTCPGGTGCPCAVDTDCNSLTICADTADGKQCLAPCLSGTACATGTTCVGIPGPNTLTTEDDKSVCAPQFPHLCAPCSTSTVCPSVGVDKIACVGLGTTPTGTEVDGANGWFCLNFCVTDADCPSDYTCLSSHTVDGDTATFCRPKTNTCTCSALAIAADATTTCASSKLAADGSTITGCSGTRACSAAGLSACSAPVAVTEICDNIDNDCNGVTDDGIQSGPGAMCDDKNGCTSDACVAGVCLATPTTATCDDGDLCTANDACAASKCSGTAVNCDDANACTTDSCDSTLGCQHVNNTAACDDGDACTTGDTCKDGSCASGTTNTCDCQSDADCAKYEDGNKCNGTLYCAKASAPYVCKINPVTIVNCDPSGDTLCRVMTCDPADAVCKFAPQNDGNGCDDNNVCTTGDLCAATACTPQGTLGCDDSNPCTTDSCDPVAGCAYAPNTAACNDGNACTGGDSCATGSCAGTPLSCDDGFACTADSCDPVLGCINKPLSGDVCQISSSYAEPFNCGSGSLDLWQRSDALSPATWVKWGFDATPAVPAAQSKACTMNINNGTDLQCGSGQTALSASVTSPSVDLSSMATGTTTKVTFYSNGTWTGSKTASVAVQIDGGGFTDLGNVAGGTAWVKVSYSSTAWAGHKVQFRFSFAGACDGDANVGWFVDDFAIFEDLCVTQPGVCGANGLCNMDATGQLDCTLCPTGYTPQNGVCSDVDECALGTAGCAATATCANTVGSFTCTCIAGYTGDGKTCGDINECATGKNNCAVNAVCTNTPGSFTCACPAGLVGDGTVCGTLGSGPGAPAISCLAIFQALPKSADGTYWLNFTGTASQYYCDMKNGGWTRLISDDFEKSQGGWSVGTVQSCGNYGNILGGYNEFGKGAAPSKTVAAPPHTQAKAWMQYIRLDAWSSQWAIVQLDGKQIWSEQSPGNEWTMGFNNKCGRWDYQDDEWDMGTPWVGAHTAATATLTATSTLDQTPDQESFGIDNVTLFVK